MASVKVPLASMLRIILRLYSYLYHLVLCLFLIGVGGIGLLYSSSYLTLKMLPWEDPALSYCLFFGGLIGLILLVLAILGRLRFLFFLWTLAVFVMMVRGFFVTPYSFQGPGHFLNIVLLTFGALLSVIGAAIRGRWRR